MIPVAIRLSGYSGGARSRSRRLLGIWQGICMREYEQAETELIERFRATGSGRWFDALYRRTRRRSFAIALKYLREPARAEDICHDAYLKAYERFDSFRGDDFSAWIGRIVANLALNALRDEHNRQRLLAESTRSENAPGTDVHAGSREELDKALSIIRQLSNEQRRCLLFRQIDGFSYAQIAGLTGFSEDQVRSYIQNARRNFRIAWQAEVAS